MRAVVMVSALMLWMVAGYAADGDRPTGMNCNLPLPPKNAGELPMHGLTFKVYPRAPDIGSNYTGCQAVWISEADIAEPKAQKWLLIALLVLERGSAVRVWNSEQWPDPDLAACRYRKGELIEGDRNKCREAQDLIAKSYPAGCIKEMASAQSSPPARCKYE